MTCPVKKSAPDADADGFLRDPAAWDDDVMRRLAAARQLQLTDAHVAVIRCCRDYYLQFAAVPSMRQLIRLLTASRPGLASSPALAELFPAPVLRHVALLAGCPKPASCV